MNSDEKEDIIKAIGELKGEIAVLNTKYDNLSNYMFKDLKGDIQKIYAKVDGCMAKAEQSYHKNLKWIATTMISLVIALFSWVGLLLKVF